MVLERMMKHEAVSNNVALKRKQDMLRGTDGHNTYES